MSEGKRTKLTPKQTKFCEYVVSGSSYKDAYLLAYSGDSEQTAYVEGSKLALREDIQAYIKTLQKPIEQAIQTKQLTIKEKQINFIEERIQHCIANNDEQSIIRYTDMLSKIYNLYKDADQDQNNVNNPLEDVATDKLLKLVNG